MIQEPWSLAHFASYKAIAIAIAITALPLIHAHNFSHNAKTLIKLLVLSLASFLLLALTYKIITSFNPLILLPFGNLNLSFFIITSIIAIFISLHATHHLHETIPLSLGCIAIVIASTLIFTHNNIRNTYNLLELSQPLNILSFILASSLALDILTHAHTKKIFLLTPLNITAASLVIISHHIHSNIIAQNILILIATLLILGLLPPFSFWKHTLKLCPRTVALTITFFQSSFALCIFFYLPFSAQFSLFQIHFSSGSFTALLLLTLVISLSFSPFHHQEKIIRILITSSLAIAAFSLSFKPLSLTFFHTLFLLSFPFYILIFQQKNPATIPPHHLVSKTSFLFLIITTLSFFFFIIPFSPSPSLSFLSPALFTLFLSLTALRALPFISTHKLTQRPSTQLKSHAFFFHDNTLIITSSLFITSSSLLIFFSS